MSDKSKAKKLQKRNVSNCDEAKTLTQLQQMFDQQMILELCPEDSMALAQTFIKEPTPSKKAIEAARIYREKMGQY